MKDVIAKPDDILSIEIQPEAGFEDRFKVYVHLGDETVFRACKLTREQIAASDELTVHLLSS